ncbi:MAG TPA: hypothetical protein PLO44_02645 [Candidatus Paceibacterota bacterium]|nr:hypothetical protein [Candidatus Paceibacterota bacterium]
MKGKLPVTGFITLESDESSWSLLVNKLVEKVLTSALVEIGEKKVRVKIILQVIFPPNSMRIDRKLVFTSQLGEGFAKGNQRTWKFFAEFLDRGSWTFLGYIDGENKVPVLIVYYPQINKAVYSQKLASENDQEFHPYMN